MRFSLVPRLVPGHPRPTASDGRPSLTVDGDGEINRAILSGVIAATPAHDTSRGGEPITVLLLSFEAPDEKTRPGSGCCEVEVPDSIADRHRRWLRVGRRVWVTGQLNGSGLWATSLGRGRPATARIAEARS